MIDPGLYKLNKSEIWFVIKQRSLPTAFKLYTGAFPPSLSLFIIAMAIYLESNIFNCTREVFSISWRERKRKGEKEKKKEKKGEREKIYIILKKIIKILEIEIKRDIYTGIVTGY
ncbi:hypothetical protein Tsubulata_029276 [Turnera subulata]|uniref:Uncharacterized protein n=1 Tax=Turnera subulata TaxID=218843 RepID=A0A9Q0GMV7_9ROSI|nr:hypothetical protein Tsubulata_029276 [Turnera subulata]